MKIKLVENAALFSVSRAPPIHLAVRVQVKWALDKMVGFITSVTSPTEWVP